MDDMSGITGEQIRAARERRRMTQQELADELGVSLRTVSNWERGESIPRNRAGAIEEFLSISESLPEFGEMALRRRLGELAKQRREELGMSARTFSVEAGLGSDKTVRNFEFARVLPYGVVQTKLEKALGWRLGAIEDTLRMVNRKASSIRMEDLDAEDSLFIAKEGGAVALEAVSDDALIAEIARRLKAHQAAVPNGVQNLFDLAASHNNEHLEEDD